MKARMVRRSNQFSRLPDELFLCLCMLLDMKDIYSMQSVSRSLEKKLTVLMSNQLFWKIMTEHYFSQEQFESLPNTLEIDYKNILLPHLTPLKTLISHFSKNPYYRYRSRFGLFSQQSSSYYTNVTGIELDLNEVKSHLVKDDANKLFSNVSRLEEILPVVQKDNFDIPGVKKIINYIEGKIKGQLMIGDVSFIGLLPSIMAFRSVKCFDLFIQAYFALIIAFPEMEKASNFALDSVSKMIFISNDDYFIQRFMSLMFAFYSPEYPVFFTPIGHIVVGKKDQLIHLVFQQLSIETKQTLLKEWRKLNKYHDLLFTLYPLEKTRRQLFEVLNKGIELLESNVELDINDLISFQKSSQSSIENFIQLYSEKLNSESNEISTFMN